MLKEQLPIEIEIQNNKGRYQWMLPKESKLENKNIIQRFKIQL